ncbi:hypothetical protein BDM02DRAFT_1866934 [Thelephora ganbajun]|uniref:Uncharacterized protein n=1 Tax=Thelephora ganbajun TaxID=370292 RepID=A0ACB6ZJK9_THEGA|nr:hypothetical protein BDM02DRAFT_1866934 [Thelephora ganbajun]
MDPRDCHRIGVTASKQRHSRPHQSQFGSSWLRLRPRSNARSKMAEQKQLHNEIQALRIAIERLSPQNKPPEVDPRRHFYRMFNQEADDYDKDFHKKYHDDLNTTLVFAGLFSGVASAFIIDVQQELRPDYNEMSFTVLTMLLNATSGVPNQVDIPVVSGPNASAVQVQSILFASLASALLAAFVAMLGKQWLNLYVDGSLIDRSRHRELRMRGMITWRFKIIMECLPFIMQLSLFLLKYALARYLWDLSHTVSAVIAAFTALGVLFYLFIVIAAMVWKTCPFQTPVSVFLRHVISLVGKHQHRRLQNIRYKLSEMVHLRKLNESFVTATLGGSIDEELAPEPQPPHDALTSTSTVVGSEEDEGTHVSDTNCISTMFRFASGSDAIAAVTEFICEVNWTSNVRRVPLLEVYHSLRKSFELLKDGRALVRPGMRAQAYSSARALLYLRVQRLCVGATDNAPIVATSLGPLLLQYRSKEDHELASTLQVLDAVFNGSEDIPWGEFVFSDSHYCWLSHIIRCRARLVLRTQQSLTKDISGFILHSFSKKTLPPRVIADCLLIVGTIVGRLPELDDRMLIKDRRLVTRPSPNSVLTMP